MRKEEMLYRKIKNNNKGMTLIEILVVIALIAGISGTLIVNTSQGRSRGRVNLAKTMISRLEDALNTFNMDCNYYPSTEEGLEALVIPPKNCESWGPKPYLKKGKVPKDPWGNNFTYTYDGSTGDFEIISLGQDGEKGGEKFAGDISSRDL